MIYTVGEMAQKLGVPAPPCATTTKKGYFPLWSVPPAHSDVPGKRLRVAAGHPLHEKSRNVHQGYPAVY